MVRVLVAGALAAGAAPAAAYTVTDDLGHTETFAQPPARIVSLLPSLTESLCELGACARLVGVDRYANWPASVAALPKLGGGLDPNVESVVALRPDVVLVATSSRATDHLRSLGLKVLAMEPRSHADLQRVLGKLSDLLALPADAGAHRVWRAIDAGVAAAAQSLPPRVRSARVYFEVGSGPYAASEASFIGETLARLGVRNIVPASLGPFPKLNPEFVVRANPDVILVGARGAASLPQRPGWAGLRAVREQRLCAFTPEQSDVLVRPGPRMPEAARLMADCLARKAP